MIAALRTYHRPDLHRAPPPPPELIAQPYVLELLTACSSSPVAAAMTATTRPLMLAVSLLLFLSSLFSAALSTTFTLTNSCAYTVWPGFLSGSGTPALPTTGFALAPGESRAVEAPAAWSGRMWGRTLCATGADGRFACATCDCGSGAVECAGGGAAPPCSLAEFTLAGSGGNDFYDVSLVDGSNIPMAVLPQGGGGGAGCAATGCLADLNGPCPADLRVAGPDGAGIACKSACEAFGRPEDCCSGAFAGGPEACRPSAYSMFFKNACPRAYSYAYDDATSTFTCASGTAAYLVVFCPTAMSSSDGESSLKSSVVSTNPTPALPHVNDTVSYLGRSRDAGSGWQHTPSSSHASSSAPSPFAIAAVAAFTWLCGGSAGRQWPLLSPS